MHKRKSLRIFLYSLPFLLSGSLFFGLTFFWPVSAQSQPDPGATPDPAVAQGLTATQQAQIDRLSLQLETVQRRADDLRFKEIEKNLNDKLTVVVGAAGAISFLAGLIGIRSYMDIEKVVKRQVEEKIAGLVDQKIFGFNPANLAIHLRKNRFQFKVREMLELTGLTKILWYEKLDENCLEGIIVVPVQSPADEEEYKAHIQKYPEQLSPQRVAFILFAQNYRIAQETLDCYPNTTLANMPVTVTNAVLVVGRGLRVREDRQRPAL